MRQWRTWTLAVVVTTLAGVAAPVAAQTRGDLFDRITSRAVVRIGIGYQTPPMNYLDDKGVLAGFDVDLAQALAGKLGLKHELVRVNNKTRISFLTTGQIDMVVSNLNHTVSRDRQIDFSDTYLRDGKRILAKAGRFKTLRDFVGRRIAVTQGSNATTAVADVLKRLGDPSPKVLSFQNEAECLLALRTGKVDGYTNDAVILAGVSRGSPQYEAVGDVYSATYYGIGVPENESKWRDAINVALRHMVIDGTYRTVYDKWFGKTGLYPLPEASAIVDIWAD